MHTPITHIPGALLVSDLAGFDTMTFDEVQEVLKNDTLPLWNHARIQQLINERISPGRILMLIQTLLLLEQASEQSDITVNIAHEELIYLQEYFFIEALLSDSYKAGNSRILATRIRKSIDGYLGVRSESIIREERTLVLSRYGLSPQSGHFTQEAVSAIISIETDPFSSLIKACTLLMADEAKKVKSLRVIAPLVIKILRMDRGEYEQIVSRLKASAHPGSEILSRIIDLAQSK